MRFQYVDAKSTKKILSAARKQQAEFSIDDSFGPPLVQPAKIKPVSLGAHRRLGNFSSARAQCFFCCGFHRNFNGLARADSESEPEDDPPDIDEHNFFDDIKLTEEDARALEMFQNK